MNKYVPDLQSRQTQIDAKAEIKHFDAPSDRELARSVLSLLHDANLEAAGVTHAQANRLDRRLTASDLTPLDNTEPPAITSGASAALAQGDGPHPAAAAGRLGCGPVAASPFGYSTSSEFDSLNPALDHSQGITARNHMGRPTNVNALYVPPDAQPPRRFLGRQSQAGPQPGDRVNVEGCRGSLEVAVVMNDQRIRYFLLDEHGQRLAPITGKKQAENALREFEETGSVDMSKRRE